MYKELKFGLTAKHAIYDGIKLLAGAVSTTLGPKGNCVVIGEYANGKPHVTKDGVTVAKNVSFSDKYKDAGAQLIREAALKMVGVVGDGTTTTTVLANAFIEFALEKLESGTNPAELIRQIDAITPTIIDLIKEKSKEISDGDIEKIATISANNDPVIGKLIGDAFEKVTKDGILVVEESDDVNTSIEIISGMQFDRGYLAPHFITDDVKNQCVLNNPLILISEQKVLYMRELVPVLNQVIEENRSILLIAEEFDSEVIENLKMNKLQNVLKVCAVKAPSFGQYRKELLDDIAILTSGQNITYDSGLTMSDVTIDMLGTCEKVIITKDNTTIINGKTSPERISHRITQLKEQLKKSESDFEKDFINGRIARLAGGIGTIYVGGTTELEMKEKKDRVEDAICATKAAIEEGVVTGGGITFLDIFKNLIPQNAGEEIIILSLNAVTYCILKNAGINFDEVFEDLNTNENIGYDAKNNKITNMFDAGIINPTKSDRLAFENAVSVLKLFIQTNCVIVDEPPKPFVI